MRELQTRSENLSKENQKKEVTEEEDVVATGAWIVKNQKGKLTRAAEGDENESLSTLSDDHTSG